MKIKETVERDCCTSKDRLVYGGRREGDDYNVTIRYCVHCGQLWAYLPDDFADPAGGPRGSDWYRLLPGRRD